MFKQTQAALAQTRIWPLLWAMLMALSWLLPVASSPWTTFFNDAWIAFIALAALVAFATKGQPAVRWYPLVAFMGALAMVPWIQFGLGLLPYTGQAWISSAYILAAMLSMILGDVWERKWPLELINSLFLAIGIACVGSVALQLYVWSGVSMGGEWGVFASGLDSVRPAGNLGQPNQLATLLLWGVLATLWGYWHRYMGAKVSILLAFLLVTGLSLTLSRTGMVNAGLIAAALLLWRKFNSGKYFKLTVFALFLYCVLLQFALPTLVESMLLGQVDGSLRAANSNSQRLLAWKIFVEAAQQQPWFGYGWTETSSAQIAVSTLFDSPGGIFSHTHNLFLDLAIWLGIPLACITAGVCVYWVRAIWVRLSATEDFIVLLLIIVVVIHSMLEFPLHYGYFLIPTGMLIGVLNARLGLKFKVGKWGSQYVALCLVGAVFWVVTVKDYVEVEDSYRLLTLEQGILGQGRPAFGGPPEVLVLTHLREWVRLARIKPNDHMSGDDLAQLETMANAYPSMPNSFNLAKALAWNGQADKARHWLNTGCRFSTKKECNLIKKSWREDAAVDRRLANVGWPE